MLYHVLCVVSLFLNSEAYRKVHTNVDPVVVYPSLIEKNAIKRAPRQMPQDIQGEWDKDVDQPSPEITKVHVRADIQYRDARMPNISWYINNTGMQMSPQTYNFPIAPTNGGGGALVAVLAPALMGGFLSASPSGSIPTKIAEVGYS